MSQTKAHPQAHPEHDKQKSHTSDAEKKALHEADAHADGASAHPVPAPEDRSHAHSHAAHLHTAGKVNTEPAGNKHQQVEPGALRQPASITQRDGKQHR